MNFMYKIAELISSFLSGVISAPPITSIRDGMIESLYNYDSKNTFVKFITVILNLLFMTILITIYLNGIGLGLFIGLFFIPSILALVAVPIAIIFEEILNHPVINKIQYECFLGYVISYGAFYIGLFTILLILFF